MVIVYYHVSTFEGITAMALTEKSYWDANHVLDDGGGSHYEDIMEAMSDCYMDEMCTSTWELESPEDVARIISAMRDRWFDLRQDEAFSNFLEGKI